jgi:serine/threonine protein kinase
MMNSAMQIPEKWDEEVYLDKGGYSEVYRVKHNGKYYALKKIFPHLLKNDRHREAIQREVDIMKSLDHPKIIKLQAAVVEED